jgi:hypothetical protein
MLINFIQELNIFTLYYIFYIPITVTYIFLIIPYYFLSIGKFIIVLITFFIPYIIKFLKNVQIVDSKLETSNFESTTNNIESNTKQKTQDITSTLIDRVYKYLEDFKNYCGEKSKETKKKNKEVINTVIIVISSCIGLLLLINLICFILYPDIYKRAIRFNNYYIEFVRIFICITMFILFNFTFSTGSMIPLFKEIISGQIIDRFNKGAESL